MLCMQMINGEIMRSLNVLSLQGQKVTSETGTKHNTAADGDGVNALTGLTQLRLFLPPPNKGTAYSEGIKPRTGRCAVALLQVYSTCSQCEDIYIFINFYDRPAAEGKFPVRQ